MCAKCLAGVAWIIFGQRLVDDPRPRADQSNDHSRQVIIVNSAKSAGVAIRSEKTADQVLDVAKRSGM